MVVTVNGWGVDQRYIYKLRNLLMLFWYARLPKEEIMHKNLELYHMTWLTLSGKVAKHQAIFVPLNFTS